MTTKKKEKMLTAIFHGRRSTEKAYNWLQELGYEPSEISVLMSDKTRAGYHDQGTEGQIKTGDGQGGRGAVGTVVGATVVAIGTSIIIPAWV